MKIDELFKLIFIGLIAMSFIVALGCSDDKDDNNQPPLPDSTVTFRITVPDSTPENDTIYIAGNFNNWNPVDANYKGKKIDSHLYEVKMDIGDSGTTILYKFTRGNWETVEKGPNCDEIANRTYTFTNQPDTVEITISQWRDICEGETQHTIVGNVTIIEDFAMPQLGRTRNLWIYLPPDYEDSTDKYYPVLYMHDGQNLFDAATSFAGEWGIDETLENFFAADSTEGVIVVGIENGGTYRVDEYVPWEFEYGGGEGDEYLDFIVQTLKPYMDTNYRTLPDRENTGIGGSSLGGLISFYAGMKFQDIFGKVCAMSSSFWVADNEIINYLNSITKQYDMRIYLDMGQQEGQDMVDDTNEVYNKLLQMGFSTDELMKVIDTDGQHNEYFWRQRFPDSFLWLYETL